MLLGRARSEAGGGLRLRVGAVALAVVLCAGTPAWGVGQAAAPVASGSGGQNGSAKAANAPAKKAVRHKRRAGKPEPALVVTPPVVTEEPPRPDWPANDPSQPAHVNWDGSRLTVMATNASLSQVLHEVSSATGLKVEGLDSSRDQRIFGSFGPAPAKDVLNQLLDGAGYNVLILGDRGAGNPRELLLAVQTGGSAKSAGNRPAMNNNAPPDEEPDPDPEPQPEPERPQQGPPPPGVRPAQQYLQDLRNQQQQQLQQQQQQGNPTQTPPNN